MTIEKNIFTSELSEPNNEPTLRLHKKMTNREIIFGSELSETNNDFRLHKNRQKIEKKQKNYF